MADGKTASENLFGETFDDPIQRQRQLQAHLLERRGKAAAIWRPYASRSMWTPHLLVRAQTHIFLCAHPQGTIHSLIRSLPVLLHGHWLKVQGISVAHLSKPVPSLRHVLVRCAFHSLPFCRFISYLFSVTTFSVDNIICSLEWNVWLLGQPKHRL